MNKLTEQNKIAALISDADKSRKKIASVSDILFDISQNDPTVTICGTLTVAARSLGTEDIPDVSGIKKYIYLARVLERIDATEKKLNEVQTELKGALTELYKTDALLRTLTEHLSKENDKLSSLEIILNQLISSDETLSENEKEILEHHVNDMNMSKIVALKNQQLIDTWTAKNNGLISGITSIETTLLPLWRSQLSEAKNTCTADNIRRSFETGRLTTEKILSFVGKASGR